MGEPVQVDTVQAKTVHLEVEDAIATIRLARPPMNAISAQLTAELAAAAVAANEDEQIRAVIIYGGEKVFAAGADIKEMAEASTVDMLQRDNLARWERIRGIKKPIIAAVSGYALGGGNELAMSCDMIIASETAVFGQPEINIGVMPGAGGTQRLTRAVGKARAMELILTGRQMPAHEAAAAGLVTRVVPAEAYLQEALRLAHEIAAKAPLAVQLAKQAVNQAYELPLHEALAAERRAFYMLFSSADQKEGMRAFVEKRTAHYQGR